MSFSSFMGEYGGLIILVLFVILFFWYRYSKKRETWKQAVAKADEHMAVKEDYRRYTFDELLYPEKKQSNLENSRKQKGHLIKEMLELKKEGKELYDERKGVEGSFNKKMNIYKYRIQEMGIRHSGFKRQLELLEGMIQSQEMMEEKLKKGGRKNGTKVQTTDSKNHPAT